MTDHTPNDIAKLAARYVNSTNRHIFLTGKAGTGKTTFLKYIVQHTHKNCVVAAPTGIAAINAGGVTLHSLLQLPFGTYIPENIPPQASENQINTPASIGKDRRFSTDKRKLIQELELLIIDEVSMLRADLLDCIDQTLRQIRRRRFEPFGGLQILFIGDLMQLPPVIKDTEWGLLQKYYKSPYFFESRALQESQPIRVELKEIYRQSDEKFIDLLNRLRHNEQNEYDYEELNKYYSEGVENMEMPGYIHLTTHNKKADHINQTRLDQLSGDERRYVAQIDGDFPETMFPTSYALSLKEGAQVMFIKNDPSGEGKFFNGKIGEICSLGNEPEVRFSDGTEIKVETYKWENKRYVLNKTTNEIDEKYLGSFEQFPLKLAWAVTVHKSQGLTFEKAILDLSGTFAPGQLYVALSRLTSLNGLVLSSPLPGNPPAIDESLQTFTESFDSEKELESKLENERISYLAQCAERAFSFDQLTQHLKYHLQSFNKAENRSEKQQYLPWTRELVNSVGTLQRTGAQFIQQVKGILDFQPDWDHLSDRMTKAEHYFTPELEGLLTKVKAHAKGLTQQAKVKSYLAELAEIMELLDSQIRQIVKLTLLVNDGDEVTKEKLRAKGYFTSRADLKRIPKKDKKPTALISLELYQKGKLPKEIAEERGLVESTIIGHLSQYVETGEIEPQHLVTEGKLKKIVEEYRSGLTSSGEIKEKLPEDVSYTDIKVGIAYAKWLEEHGQLGS